MALSLLINAVIWESEVFSQDQDSIVPDEKLAAVVREGIATRHDRPYHANATRNTYVLRRLFAWHRRPHRLGTRNAPHNVGAVGQFHQQLDTVGKVDTPQIAISECQFNKEPVSAGRLDKSQNVSSQ